MSTKRQQNPTTPKTIYPSTCIYGYIVVGCLYIHICTYMYIHTHVYNTEYKRGEDMYKSEISLKPLVNYLYRNEIYKQSAASEFVFR